jgi:transposase InsO family protein
MNDRPRGAREFQRLLQRHAADIDQLPQRVMHLVCVGVVCAFLDDTRHDDGAHLFIVKGGTAMQLRSLTMTYVGWFNHRRLHGEITDDTSYTTPAEFEAAYYSQNPTALEAVTR